MKETRITTDYGLDVLFCPAPTRSSAAVFTVLAGYGKESPSEYGMAHLIEHMFFKGDGNTASDRAMALCGAEWNASTSPHFVNYYLHCPSENMPRAMALLAGMFFSQLISDASLLKEKKVAASESAGTNDDPSSWFQSHIMSHHLDPVVGHSCFGRKSTVKGFSSGDLARFRSRHYRSKNTVLAVCGGFDPNAVRKALELSRPTMAWLSPTQEHLSCPLWMEGARKELSVEREGITQANLVAMFPAPGVTAKDGPAYRVMLSVLGGGMFSILNRRVREELAICYNVSADEEDFLGNRDFSVGSIELSCSMANMARAREEIGVCARMVLEGKFDDELLECAKQSMIGSVCDIGDSPLATAFMYSTRFLFGDDNPDLEGMIASYSGVTRVAVVRAAREFLDPDGFRWSTMVPSGKH